MTIVINSISRVIFNGTALLIPIYVILFFFQLFTPATYWFEYHSVEAYRNPIGAFAAWEPLQFRTVASRHRDIKTQYQDTLYCIDENRTKKYPTDIEPPNYYQLRNAWEVNRVWQIRQIPDPNEKECSLCYNTIGVTSLWIEKVQSWCTKWFSVNSNEQQVYP